jgi:hypothetical protein
MATVILVRHGRTAANVSGVLAGRVDGSSWTRSASTATCLRDAARSEVAEPGDEGRVPSSWSWRRQSGAHHRRRCGRADIDGDGVPDEARALTAAKRTGSAVKGAAVGGRRGWVALQAKGR